MSNPRERSVATILLLTEDSANTAPDVIEAVVRKMLFLVDRSANLRRLTFEPADPTQQRAVSGTAWKNSTHRDRVNLIQSIASRLGQSAAPGFVVFHFDGDQPWSARAKSENVVKFAEFVRVVESALAFPGRTKVPTAPSDVAAAIARLLRVTPFYTMESWLYRNASVAAKLCKCHRATQCQTVAKVGAWKAGNEELEEVVKPKEELCFGSTQNRKLAQSAFPAAEVHSLKMSFHESVLRLGSCADLVTALASTHQV